MIPVNSRVLKVTKSLRDVQAHVARIEVFLWIDAKGINQMSDEECGGQVSIMSAKYGRARIAMSWLARGDADTMQSFWFLGCSEASKTQFEKCTRKLKKCLLSIRYLSRLPHWSRTWIIKKPV